MSRIIVLISLLFLSACGSIRGEDYAETGADFDLFSFFEGEVKAYGIIQDRSGTVVQRFEVEILGSVEDNVLTLDETFTYSIGDGMKKRLWTIKDLGEGRYTGGAGDLEGPADGEDFGNAFYWAYEMEIDGYNVTFKDWMWAFDEGNVINRSYITKFGITFAEVTLFMQKKR